MLIKDIKNRMKRKAINRRKSGNNIQKYFIVAAGISKKGNFIEMALNRPAEKPGNRCYHAEGILISKYGRKLEVIYIARFGNSGDELPIKPCEQCRSIADRMGIKIVSLS